MGPPRCTARALGLQDRRLKAMFRSAERVRMLVAYRLAGLSALEAAVCGVCRCTQCGARRNRPARQRGLLTAMDRADS